MSLDSGEHAKVPEEAYCKSEVPTTEKARAKGTMNMSLSVEQ